MRCIGPGWPRSNKAAAAGGGGRGLALGLVDAPLPSEHACLLEERAVCEEAVAVEEVVKQVVQLAHVVVHGSAGEDEPAQVRNCFINFSGACRRRTPRGLARIRGAASKRSRWRFWVPSASGTGDSAFAVGTLRDNENKRARPRDSTLRSSAASCVASPLILCPSSSTTHSHVTCEHMSTHVHRRVYIHVHRHV